MDEKALFTKFWTHETTTTRKVLTRIPDGSDYRPDEKSRTAKEIADYLDSGYTVIGVVGIDGSPSCGVGKTLDLERSFDSLASVDTASITAEKMNAIVRRNLIVGSGLFTDALEEELRKRRIKVPFLAHDLIGELEGEKSSVDLFAAGDHSATGTGPPSRGG